MVRWLYILLVAVVVTASCAAKKRESSRTKMEALHVQDSLRSELIHVKSKGIKTGVVQKDSVYSDGLRLVGFTGTIRPDGTVEGTADEVQQSRKGQKKESAQNAETLDTDSLTEVTTTVSEREERKVEETEKKSDRKSNHKGIIISAAIAIVLVFLGVRWVRKVA